jgi:hypothetical protein
VPAKLVAPAGLRAAVSYVEVEYELSERHACRLLLARSTNRYRDSVSTERVIPEFRGRALAAWSAERGVRLKFISAASRRKTPTGINESAGLQPDPLGSGVCYRSAVFIEFTHFLGNQNYSYFE